MSDDELIIKTKRKRHPQSTVVDFMSPYPPEECINRLKDSHSPLPEYPKVVVGQHENTWEISFYRDDKRALIWFLGRLDKAFEGTWIRGRIEHEVKSIDDPELLVLWGIAAVVILGLAYIHLISELAALLLVSFSFMFVLPCCSC